MIVSADGQTVVATFGSSEADAKQHKIRAIAMKTGKTLFEIQNTVITNNGYDLRTPYAAHNVLFWEDDEKAVVAYVEGALQKIDLATGKLQKLFEGKILDATPAKAKGVVILRDEEKLFVLRADGKTEKLMDLSCSKDNWCKESTRVTPRFAYFTVWTENRLIRCDRETLKCEETKLPGLNSQTEFDVQPDDSALIIEPQNGKLAVYPVSASPFGLAASPEGTLSVKEGTTALAWLDPQTFANGRGYYFVGILDRKSFKAKAEFPRPAPQDGAVVLRPIPNKKRVVVGTGQGRILVLDFGK